MKSLSLTRPVIIMMLGVPGSGKSFFARQFADTFHAPLVSHDIIRASILVSPEYSRQEEDMVQAIEFQQIHELVKTQKTFVIDGGLSARTERFDLQKLAKSNGYETLTVWVQTDEPASRMRATKRSQRRQGDIYNTSLTGEQFETLSKRLTPPLAQEPFVVISGKHTYATQAKTVLKKLVVSRQEQVERPGAYSSQAYDQPVAPPTPPRRRNVIIN